MSQDILLNMVVSSKESAFLSSAYEKCYAGWFKQVYTFKNTYDESIMKVIKLYDDNEQTKCLIPATMWMRNYSTENQLFCIPLPDKQPLYNLDLLSKEKDPVVILTDSIEIADAYQKKCPPTGVVFTSFICDQGQYDQVDFKPLQNARIYYLITNHSGGMLETAYLKAKEIAEHFMTLEQNLKFIQIEVDFATSPRFNTVDDIIKDRPHDFARINERSLIVLETWEAFMVNHKKAEMAIQSKPQRFWDNRQQNTEEQQMIKKDSNKPPMINYVVRPFLIKGEFAMLYAGKSTGKSALALSMAAAATSSSSRPKPLFLGKWWTVPKNDYGMYKVLYLDFENGEKEMKQRVKDFAEPYWPSNKDDREKCRKNLIIKDMTASGIDPVDFSLPANHQQIIDMLEKAKDEGMKGQSVDLLIIDTYTKFVRTENPQTPSYFSAFIHKVYWVCT